MGSSPMLATDTNLMAKKQTTVKTSIKTAAKTKEGLNHQQEEFCQLYINGDKDLFGNGSLCYLEVYGTEYKEKTGKQMSYDVAKVCASQLLTKPNIVLRVNQLLAEHGEAGFNDQNVDRQHLFMINQFGDLKVKLGAVKEYNVLKSRVKNRMEVHVLQDVLTDIENAKTKKAGK
jgi:hypothetical protein